jgi:hypothetical protein
MAEPVPQELRDRLDLLLNDCRRALAPKSEIDTAPLVTSLNGIKDELEALRETGVRPYQITVLQKQIEEQIKLIDFKNGAAKRAEQAAAITAADVAVTANTTPIVVPKTLPGTPGAEQVTAALTTSPIATAATAATSAVTTGVGSVTGAAAGITQGVTGATSALKGQASELIGSNVTALPGAAGAANLLQSAGKQVPGIPAAACGSNAKIEELNALKAQAEEKLASLTSGAGGITGSLDKLKSTMESATAAVQEKMNANLIGEKPVVGLNLQEEFKSALTSFASGSKVAAMESLAAIQKTFPKFDLQEALNKAGGILPAGAMPSNIGELIKKDLSNAVNDMKDAASKLTALGGAVADKVTGAIGDATKALGSAASSLTSGVGSIAGVQSLTSQAQAAVGDATKQLGALGGAFSAIDNPAKGLLDSAGSKIGGITGNLLPAGIAKIPAFDMCSMVPNQQVENGVVVEKPPCPVKPTENATPPLPPAPAPVPATPVVPNKYAFSDIWNQDLFTQVKTLGNKYGQTTWSAAKRAWDPIEPVVDEYVQPVSALCVGNTKTTAYVNLFYTALQKVIAEMPELKEFSDKKFGALFTNTIGVSNIITVTSGDAITCYNILCKAGLLTDKKVNELLEKKTKLENDKNSNLEELATVTVQYNDILATKKHINSLLDFFEILNKKMLQWSAEQAKKTANPDYVYYSK